MKFYPYCLVGQRVELSQSLRGVDGREILQMDVGTLTAILSECNETKVELTRENVLRHDAVVSQVLDVVTPLPFRFGHLVTLDQLTGYVESKSGILRAKLQDLHNCVEMSVKIIWDRETDLRVTKSEPQSIHTVGKGAAFLMSKRAEIQAEEANSAEVAAIAGWLKTVTHGLVRADQIVLRPAEKLVLSASFLVDRTALGAYKKRTSHLESERPDLHFLTSGPWAPYSFSNNDLEFKTHLGVS
jgi:hypothetical protein